MTDLDALARETWERIALENPSDPADGVDPDGAFNIIAAALFSVRNEALEEAAKVAQEQHVYGNTFIATAIRALKEGGQRGGKA